MTASKPIILLFSALFVLLFSLGVSAFCPGKPVGLKENFQCSVVYGDGVGDGKVVKLYLVKSALIASDKTLRGTLNSLAEASDEAPITLVGDFETKIGGEKFVFQMAQIPNTEGRGWKTGDISFNGPYKFEPYAAVFKGNDLVGFGRLGTSLLVVGPPGGVITLNVRFGYANAEDRADNEGGDFPDLQPVPFSFQDVSATPTGNNSLVANLDLDRLTQGYVFNSKELPLGKLGTTGQRVAGGGTGAVIGAVAGGVIGGLIGVAAGAPTAFTVSGATGLAGVTLGAKIGAVIGGTAGAFLGAWLPNPDRTHIAYVSAIESASFTDDAGVVFNTKDAKPIRFVTPCGTNTDKIGCAFKTAPSTQNFEAGSDNKFYLCQSAGGDQTYKDENCFKIEFDKPVVSKIREKKEKTSRGDTIEIKTTFTLPKTG